MGSSAFWRALFGVTASIFFVWFLSKQILSTSRTTTGIPSSAAITAIESTKHSNSARGYKPASRPDLDLIYMSKRRVPNGPDPIHNRRAGKSRQPPGRA